MEKDIENYNELIANLALICDAIEKFCPLGKGTLVYELNPDKFLDYQKKLTKNKTKTDKFILNFSGINVVFISNE